ncbi:MAG: serine acetyltransferase [Clostridia bacterium]|nr:serine acetyltransferase [Clostridia bacterium]
MLWRSILALLVYTTLDKETKEKIKMDLNPNQGWFQLHSKLLNNKIFRRLLLMRIGLKNSIRYYIVRITYPPKEDFEIGASTTIGGGVKIYHGHATVVNCYSMGKNCAIYQNVTIGRGKTINGINTPIIGDNVQIFAGAIIVGGIRIGDNAKIGAGAVVVKDVPPNVTVVGSAGRIIETAKD